MSPDSAEMNGSRGDHDERPTEIALEVRSGSLAAGKGTAQIAHLSKRARTAKAARICIGLALAALITVPIPGVHFIVPPICVLCIPAGIRYAMRSTRMIAGGTAVCPGCGSTIEIFRVRAAFPLSQNCPSCARPLTLTPREGV